MRWLSATLILKFLAGTALWGIYKYYYPTRSEADIFKYFDDGMVLFGALQENPADYFKMLLGIQNDTAQLTETYYRVMNHWYREYETTFYNDAHTIIRWNALVLLFSFGNFHIHTIFMSFLSLLGCVGLFRALKQDIPRAKIGLFIACFLLPSVLLWSSAPSKEGLLICGLGIFTYQFFKLGRGAFHFPSFLILLLAAVLIFFQKFYVLASMLPGLIVALWVWRREKPHWLVKVLVALSVAISAVFVLEALSPEYGLIERMTRKQHDFINHGLSTGSGSMIELMRLDGTVWTFIKSIPHALYTTLLGPTTNIKGGVLGLFTNLENILILVSLLLAILHMKKNIKVHHGTILLCVGFVSVLFILIGWTTPVLGALVRYRIPALPFLLILALIVVDREKIVKRFPFSKILFK